VNHPDAWPWIWFVVGYAALLAGTIPAVWWVMDRRRRNRINQP
jgi:hypothetical protein